MERTRKHFLFGLLLAMMLIIFGVMPKGIYASTDVSSYVTGISIENSSVNVDERVKVKVTFDDGSGDEHIFHGGDTITVSWPTSGDAYIKAYSKTIPLVSSDGITYANAVITSKGATVTFLDSVNDMYDISGSIWFEALAKSDSDDEAEKTFTGAVTAGNFSAEFAVTKPASSTGTGESNLPFFRKQPENVGGGWQRNDELGWIMGLDPDDPTYTEWALTANENNETITSDLVIKDTLGEGQRIDYDYNKCDIYANGKNACKYEGTITEVVEAFNSEHSDSQLTINNGNITWKIGQNTVNGTDWHFHYRCEITDFSLETFSNKATVQYSDASGSPTYSNAEGYFSNVKSGADVVAIPRGVVQVTKKVKGTDLAVEGVEFTVQKLVDDEWQTVGTMSTDESGIATMTKLKFGSYRIFESAQPTYLESDFVIDGKTYSKSNPYTFEVSNDKSASGIAIDVSNGVKTSDVKALKIWKNLDGSEDTSDHETIYFQLYRKTANSKKSVKIGSPMALENGTTEAAWNDMPMYDVHGNEYEYSVKEVNAAGEDSAPEGYNKEENGLVVTNTRIIENEPENPGNITPINPADDTDDSGVEDVEEPSENPTENPSEDVTDDETETEEAKTDSDELTEETSDKSTSTPKTGDNAEIIVWSMIGMSSIAAILCMIVYRKKLNK